MTCASATALTAVSPLALHISAGAHAANAPSGNALSVNAPRTARGIAAGSVNRGAASSNSTADAEPGNPEGTPAGAESGSPPLAFADIIRQISSSPVASQAVAASANQGISPRFQLTNATLMPGDQPLPETYPASSPNARPGNKKEAASLASASSGTAGSGSIGAASLARDRQAETPVIPVDVVAPLPPPRPKVFGAGRTGGSPETQPLAPSAARARLQPEAALTVVIRTGDLSSAPPNEPAPQGTATSGASNVQATEDAGNGLDPAGTEKSGQASDGIVSSTETQAGQVAQPAAEIALAIPESAGLLSPATEVERKKSAAGTPADGSDTDIAGNATSQAASVQNFQVKAEAGNGADYIPPRNDAPRPPAALPEPPSAEKSPTQPVRYVALEFTPDGASDVRVRLSERAGEVHVSLHSTDPSITKNLRDGVTDLASVLAHAGYDAKTWTSGSGEQDHPQHREEQAPQRRSTGSSAETESFDGILRQPNQEVS